MTTLKDEIINDIIRVEGGYVNDVNDSGGETNFGITRIVARDNGFMDDMNRMSKQDAFNIYVAKYWEVVKADDIVELSEAIAAEVVDTSVNMGPNRAGKFLQRSLNVLNNRGSLYPDLIVDGNIGPATISALTSYLNTRSSDTLVKMLNCLQGAYYVELAERREKDERFIYGWFNNRVG